MLTILYLMIIYLYLMSIYPFFYFKNVTINILIFEITELLLEIGKLFKNDIHIR